MSNRKFTPDECSLVVNALEMQCKSVKRAINNSSDARLIAVYEKQLLEINDIQRNFVNMELPS